MKIRTLFTHMLWVTLALSLAACDPPPNSSDIVDPPPPGEATSFSFKLSAFDDGLGGAAALPAGSGPMMAPVRITGELLVAPHDGTAARVYSFDLEIDPDSVQVLTVYNQDLAPGPYDFFFLLKSPQTRFGGLLRNRMIVGGGTNTIGLTLDPIVGVLVDSVLELAGLTPFAVRYDPEEIAGYAHPRFAVSIDGGPEIVFDIVYDPDSPVILLFLQPGSHELDVRFYDGAILKDVSVDQPVELPPPPPPGDSSGSDPLPEISLVMPTTVAKYSYVATPGETAGTATLHFAIPDEVVQEVDGTEAGTLIESRLQVHAAIVDSDNTLWEQGLVLTPVLAGDGAFSHYTSEISLAGFAPGRLTWALTFIALTDPAGVIGYCADTVADTRTANPDDPDSATLSCPLVLLDRSKLALYPVAQVQVTVTDAGALPLGGAVVTAVALDAAGQPVGEVGPLGITGGGGAGTLASFLSAGTYRFQAHYSGAESSPPATVSLAAGGSVGLTLSVPFTPPDLTPPGPVTGFMAAAGDGEISLSWLNPTDGDFHRVLVRRKVGSAPLSISDGEWVADTADTSVSDKGLTNGEHYFYAAYARDHSGNWALPAFADAVPVAQAVSTIDLTAARSRRPTVHADDGYDVESGSIRVRIPSLGKPPGSEGDPNVPGVEVEEGNPDRFLLRLRLGRVTCFYLGGQFDRHIEGTEIEDFFRHGFSSPLCYPGNLGAGDVVEVRAHDRGHDDDDGDRSDRNSDQRHHHHDEINARVIVADPHVPRTQVGVTIEVVQP